MTTRTIAIVAMSDNRVIGLEGKLPWRIPEDMIRFKELTTGHAVCMGRKTYDSLPPKFKPLPGRQNIVITKLGGEYPESVIVLTSILELEALIKKGSIPLLWIAGGTEIYKATMHLWDQVELTRVPGQYQGDVFFPEFEKDFERVQQVAGTQCLYETWKRI